MKTRITQSERLDVADWIRDARQLLVDVEGLERQIADTLGIAASEHADAITDAIGTYMSVDQLLRDLQIAVDES